MTSLMLDLRSARRSLARSPWFASLAILTLTLGIGLNTALFSMVDAVLLRSLPSRDAGRLVEIWGMNEERSGMRVPAPFLEALQSRAKTLQLIGVHDPAGGDLRTAEGPLDIRGDRVSANFVDLMGVPPRAGRGFLPDEGNPDAAAVMLVSHSFWQRYLGGDPAAVGRSLTLDSTVYTVVGIMPSSFQTRFRGTIPTGYWTPHVNPGTRNRERELGYEILARLAPGVTLEDARREVAAIGASVEFPEWGSTGRRLGMVRLKNEVLGDSADALPVLFGAVAVVLVIVCANLALLQLARSDRQVSEFATRKAMGAPVSHLFRLALTESLIVSVAGGLGGVALAYGLLPVMLALAPAEIPRITQSAIDGRVLAAAVGLTLLTGCTFGLVPALRLSRLSLLEAMKRSTGKFTARATWFRSGLVTGQVAASVALCIMAGLLGRSFLTLVPADAGFETRGLTTYSTGLSRSAYPDSTDRRRRLEELVRRVGTQPGVSGAALATNIPFSGDESPTPVENLTAERRIVSPNYFELLRLPLEQGRVFSTGDVAGSPPVAIVNQALARRLAPDGNVVGRLVRAGRATPQVSYEIVGVVADARSTGSAVDVWNEIYLPYAQSTHDYGFVILRTSLGTGEVASLMNREIRAVAPEEAILPSTSARTMEDLVRSSLAGPRFSAALVSTFSLAALVLAAMGVFGLVACSVSQRRRELGIRAALGARPGELAIAAMRPALLLAAGGLATGVVAAAWGTRFVEKQLYAVDPWDLPTFAGAALVMGVVAGAAASIPARLAMRADPMDTLRYE